jgi:hypothetical protein
MAIKKFKDIIDNKGYRISSADRQIFEQGNLQSFFGLGEQDAIEFIVYDANDNQLPQGQFGGLVRYVTLSTENIKDYILLPEGTMLQRYQFPKEYFVDVERLLNEAGYKNGIFKTQITLINKRVGTEQQYNKLWINEISPSRNEIRLLPLDKGIELNPELLERFSLLLRDGNFRDDTIYFMFQFIEKIKPQEISSFIISKYSEKFLRRIKTEFNIQDFEVFSTTIYNKFVESAAYEFTNRISNIRDGRYGQLKTTKTGIELTKSQIVDTCKRLLASSVDYYLSYPNVTTNTTFDAGNDASFDEVGKVLQRLNADTTVDTSSPIVELVKITTKKTTQTELIIAREKEQTKKEVPATKDDKKQDPPVEEPPKKEVIVMRNYMVSNLGRELRRDGDSGPSVVVRHQNEFKDGKQIILSSTDSIDICALKGSVSVDDTDVRTMIKDVGPCDKTDIPTTKISRPQPSTERGIPAGVTGRGGTFDNPRIGSVKDVEEPATEQLV